MTERLGQKAIANDEIIFAEEDTNEPAVEKREGAWRIIIADDDEEVHNITKMVLGDYRFDGRPLNFLHTYSGRETERIINEYPDTAILLLDVVMETDSSGLDVVRYIRDELKNSFVRIILRTGQPGK